MSRLMMLTALFCATCAIGREITIKDIGKPNYKDDPVVAKADAPAVMLAPLGSVGLIVDLPKLAENFQKACEPKHRAYYHEEIAGLGAGKLYADASGGMTDSKVKTSGDAVAIEKPGICATVGATITDHPYISVGALAGVVTTGIVAYNKGWFGMRSGSSSSDSSVSVPSGGINITGNNNQVQVVLQGGTQNNTSPQNPGATTATTTTTSTP